MKAKRVGLMLTALWSVTAAAAVGPDSLWRKGNEAYRAQRYEEALMYYDAVLKNGWVSPELYYNMGNAYFRLARNGKALLMYEKRLELAYDRLTLRNIRMVYDRLEKVRIWPPDFFLIHWWKRWLQLAMPRTWWWAALVMLVPGLALLAAWIWTRRPHWRNAAIIAWGLHFLLLASAWGRHEYINGLHYGIVTAGSTYLYEAPSEESRGLATLYEGDKVKITDRLDAWYEVILPEGARGWVRKGAVEDI